MNEYIMIFILTTISGACIPLGGSLGAFRKIRPRWLENELRHFLIAFGGGILLGAVCVVLVPKGTSELNKPSWVAFILLLGGLCFFVIERLMGLQQREAPQLLGMLLDYIPEAMALGGMVAGAQPEALLLALLIGLQNLPEGFNAYRELIRIEKSSKKTLMIMWSLVALGPVAGIGGYIYLGAYPQLLGGIMLFAAGGILYLIFQDIAPQAHLKKHWGPPLGAVCGFCLAVMAQTMLHGNAL